jgi:sigma-B regulation protein RsbU (phosphoserine phosphatase)
MADGRIEGVFTERDLLRRATEARETWNHAPISRFMTPNPVSVSPNVVWADAMTIMDQQRIRHLPVVEHGQLVGMLSVRDLLHHRAAYLEALVRDRTMELAGRNAALTERDQEMTRHLRVAAKIQRRLLPERLPDFLPIRFAVAFHGHDQVTGDFHDFMPLSDDRLSVLIADASGHGVPAAFVSVMTKMCCTAYCQGLDSPATILSTLNEHLGDLIEDEHFVTMFAATVDRRTNALTYARAGHPLPLWFRSQGRSIVPLDAPGATIGILQNPGFTDRRVQLEHGDKVLFFTDGVPECRDDNGELFGTAALASFLERHGDLSCDQLLSALETEIARFRGKRPFDDDVTIIVLEA